jgi:hypothetical protein
MCVVHIHTGGIRCACTDLQQSRYCWQLQFRFVVADAAKPVRLQCMDTMTRRNAQHAMKNGGLSSVLLIVRVMLKAAAAAAAAVFLQGPQSFCVSASQLTMYLASLHSLYSSCACAVVALKRADTRSAETCARCVCNFATNHVS